MEGLSAEFMTIYLHVLGIKHNEILQDKFEFQIEMTTSVLLECSEDISQIHAILQDQCQ